MVVLPTGSGKTVTFADIIRERRHVGQTLVLAHRDELLEQNAEKILQAVPTALVAIEQAEQRAQLYADVIVASVPTLGRKGSERLARFVKRGQIKTIITDEAHHAAAQSYLNIYKELGFIRDKQGYLHTSEECLHVGFTATPQRSDGLGLEKVFDEVVYSRDILEMIRDGYLCDIVADRIYSNSNIDKVGTKAGDFNDSQLSSAINNDARNELIVKGYIDHASGKQCIVFCVDVAHVMAVTEMFDAAGVKAGYVVGATEKGQRRHTIEQFRNGEIQVLVNCMVATEGFDVPTIECVILARPTKSQNVYIQQLGRGLRTVCDLNLPTAEERLARIAASPKPFCHILDVVDNTSKHSPIMAATIFGLPAKLNMRHRKMTDVVSDIEAIEKEYPGARENIVDIEAIRNFQTRAVRVDILAAVTIPEVVKKHSDFKFAQQGTSYKLNVDKAEAVTIRENALGQWEGVLEKIGDIDEHGKLHKYPVPEQIVLGHTSSVKDAFDKMDKYVRLEFNDRLQLLQQKAHWHDDPVSPKQVPILLKSCGAYYAPDGKLYVRDRSGSPVMVTKGIASSIMNQVFARA